MSSVMAMYASEKKRIGMLYGLTPSVPIINFINKRQIIFEKKSLDEVTYTISSLIQRRKKKLNELWLA